jgi:hypothetical protein
MSVDIYLWEHPSHLPPLTTLEEGVQEFLALSPKELGIVNPKFIAFGEQLAQRFPGADSFSPDSDEAQDAAWPTSPAHEAKQVTSAVYVFGLPDNQWECVMAAAVELGTKAGLTVLIDLLGILFLPTGEILPDDAGAFIWENFLGALEDRKKPESEFLSKPDLRRLMTEEIKKILAPHGFRLEKKESGIDGSFTRSIQSSKQKLSFRIMGYSPSSYACEIFCTVIENAVAEVGRGALGYEDAMQTFFLNLAFFSDPPYTPLGIGTPKDRANVFSLVANQALRLFNQSTNLNELDLLLNGPQSEPLRSRVSERFISPVIVAWLTRNPNLQSIIDYALEHTQGGGTNAQWFINALAAYFQKHPDYKDIVVRTRLKAGA